jgi:hypothetical protein
VTFLADFAIAPVNIEPLAPYVDGLRDCIARNVEAVLITTEGGLREATRKQLLKVVPVEAKRELMKARRAPGGILVFAVLVDEGSAYVHAGRIIPRGDTIATSE